MLPIRRRGRKDHNGDFAGFGNRPFGATYPLVDLDPQCNATSGLGIDPTPRHPLVTGQGIAEAVVPTTTKNLEVLPGCGRFSTLK